MFNGLFEGAETPKEEVYYGAVNRETGVIEGFYIESIHGKERCDEILRTGGVPLSEELWQELLSYGQAKVNISTLVTVPMPMSSNGEFYYTIDHKNHFEKVVPEQSGEDYIPEPSEVDILKEQVSALEHKMDQILSALSTR